MIVIPGFAFQGFRSFHGDELAALTALAKINLIAGQNNGGKSNVLRVARDLRQLYEKGVKGLDVPRVQNPPPFKLAINIGTQDDIADKIAGGNGNLRRHTLALLGHTAIDIFQDGYVWLWNEQDDINQSRPNGQQVMALTSAGTPLVHFAQSAGHQGSQLDSAATVLIRKLRDHLAFPQVRMVDAFRRVDDTDDGKTLIQRLAALQRPSLEHDDDRRRFDAINRFLGTVIEDRSARLEVNHDATELNVRRFGMLLPLENLGTGVAQVVMLAAAASLAENMLVCIEEPEVHLHPLLQRKFLRYLHDNTSNQYLIATHSAHLLDTGIASVFHATYTQNGTTIQAAGKPDELSKVCVDLGYRPSDLLQANCVVWVEGPSDRTYIRRWLQIANPGLQEGIDYSIMFYGGRLLSHLSADDPEVHEFISLRRLNRYVTVVIDSDKRSPHSHINNTKKRIRDEISAGDGPGLVWITKGRTIENYVPKHILEAALKSVHPKRKAFVANDGLHADVVGKLSSQDAFRPDKVKVAAEICRRWEKGLDYLDLHAKVTELARLIGDANGHNQKLLPEKSRPAFK